MKKFDTLTKDWNQFTWQLKGSLNKEKRVKRYLTMEEKLRACIKKWRDMRKIPGWTQTLENMRSNWRDRGKYLRGKEAINGKA